MRHDGRFEREIRPLTVHSNPNLYAKGSVSLKLGNTEILCSATLETIDLPKEKLGQLEVTYQFLPTAFKNRRALTKIKKVESESFLEKNFAKLLDFKTLEGKKLMIDCLILQGDGGELAACFNGGQLALQLLIRQSMQEGSLTVNPLKTEGVAVACGLLKNGQAAVDLDATEEKEALGLVDFIVTKEGDFYELAPKNLKKPLTSDDLNALLFFSTTAAKDYFAYFAENLVVAAPKLKKDTLVVATKNPGKAKEFAELFAPLGFEVKTLLDFPELPEIAETGKTFEENAILKAEGIAAILKQVVIADDSGIMVDALDHLPGIYSARFAGLAKSSASNNAKLLATLANVPKENRQAQFYCALAVAAPHKKTLTVHGLWAGEIATIPQGDAGFGYDPLFYIPELRKTAAELSKEEKNQYSHRARALKALEDHWENWWKGESDEIYRSE